MVGQENGGIAQLVDTAHQRAPGLRGGGSTDDAEAEWDWQLGLPGEANRIIDTKDSDN